MTKLLASVRTPAEALMALDAGVDIIDLKDPEQGVLGALPLDVIKEIVQLIDGRAPISATIGDIPTESDRTMFAIEHTASQGVNIIKVGFFNDDGHDRFLESASALTGRGLQLVAVLFADQKPNTKILPKLKKAGFFGVMMDTANKSDKNLMDHASTHKLREFLEIAHQNGLETGLAGSLQLTDIPVLTPLKPGYLGFRGALCEQLVRRNPLVHSNLMKARKLLHESNSLFEYVEWA